MGKETLERRRSGQTGWGPARGVERVRVPCIPSPEAGTVGRLEGTPRAAVHQSCSAHLSAVAPPPTGTPALFQEKYSGQVGGRKRRRRASSEGRQGCPPPGGNQVPLASPGHLWARPLGELSHSSEERLFQPRTGQHEVKGACCLSRGRAQGFQPTSLSPVLPPVNPVETAGF